MQNSMQILTQRAVAFMFAISLSGLMLSPTIA